MALTIALGPTWYTEPRGRMRAGAITFDNAYPATGYVVTAEDFGMKMGIAAIFFQVINVHVSYKPSTGRIQVWAGSAAHTHNLFLKNGAKLDVDISRVNAGANLLGNNTADQTVAGSGANGGVVANTALVPLTEWGTGVTLAGITGFFIAVGE
jgi:hypothetical protein